MPKPGFAIDVPSACQPKFLSIERNDEMPAQEEQLQ
jgi:hypothetical protein